MISEKFLLAVSFATCVKKERFKLLEVVSCLVHVQLVCVCVCFIIPQQLAWTCVDVLLGKMGVAPSISGCFSLFALFTHSLPPLLIV